MASVNQIPRTVKFRVELQALVATTGSYPEAFLNHAAQPIESPPPGFTYIPEGFLSAKDDVFSGQRAGWVLQRIAIALAAKGLTTNWALSDGSVLTDYIQDENTWDSQKEWMKPVEGPLFNTSHAWFISYAPKIDEPVEHDAAKWVAVTIRSPMYATGVPCLQTPFQGLADVLRILTEDFVTVPINATRLRVMVSPTEDNLTLDGLKVIASLLWAADPALTQLHPKHCGPGSFESVGLQFTNLARNQECINVPFLMTSADKVEDPWNNHLSPNRPLLSILPHPGQLRDAKFSHGIAKIQRVDEFSELVKLLDLAPQRSGSRYPSLKPAYDFQEADGGLHSTIKFNQHCGTLDFDAITHWASICANIVSFGVDSPEEELVQCESLAELIQDKDSISGFLAILGLDMTTRGYYRTKGPAIELPDYQQWPELQPAVPSYTPGAKATVGEALLPFARWNYDKALKDRAAKLITWNRSPKAAYTMGVEMELLLPLWNSDAPDPNPEDSRQCIEWIDADDEHRELCKRMLQDGHFAACPDPDEPYVDEWKVVREMAKAVELSVDPSFDLAYQTWRILQDHSINTCCEWRGYERVRGVEIVSPILRDRPECWESLLSAITGLRSRVRLAVDNSCGFHVSVGKGSEMIPHHLLRKLVCLMYCADPIIFSLCHPFRRNGSYFATSLRLKEIEARILGPSAEDPCFPGFGWTEEMENEVFEERADFFTHFDVNNLQERRKAVLKRLWEMPSDRLQESIEWMGNRSCLSLRRAKSTQYDGYHLGSVEFRYLEGTLDPQLILRFSQLMVSLFEFADNAKPEAFAKLTSQLLLCDNWRDYDVNVLQGALEQLDLSDDFEYWQGQVVRNREIESDPTTRDRSVDVDPDSWVIMDPLESDEVESLRRDVCQRRQDLGKPDECTDNASTEELTAEIFNCLYYIYDYILPSDMKTREKLDLLYDVANELPAPQQDRIYEGVASLILNLCEVISEDGIEAETAGIVAIDKSAPDEERDTKLLEDPKLKQFWLTLTAGLDGLLALATPSPDESSDYQVEELGSEMEESGQEERHQLPPQLPPQYAPQSSDSDDDHSKDEPVQDPSCACVPSLEGALLKVARFLTL
ncbi:hypothetical protein B0T10DRAFT_472201 [Thelonectria olida]|uniref:Uncharacterized protein n=1 Tax=Thelonectria olida TaxID=1576542 RepID=A0A9P8WHV4_9HYPO|nr:hypothetical protein B0T10DRAFT_472201 [Thelonectria olida]